MKGKPSSLSETIVWAGLGKALVLPAVFIGLTACIAGRPSSKAWSSAESSKELMAPGRGE